MGGEHDQLRIKAEDYLRQHRIVELFEDLSTSICYHQPEDINQFLVDQLKLKQTHGFRTGIFSQEEIKNIFNLFDLTKSNMIKEVQCREALKILASSQLQTDVIDKAQIPAQVNVLQFQNLCYELLGLKEKQ